MTIARTYALFCISISLLLISCNPSSSDIDLQVKWTLVENLPLDNGTTTHNAIFEVSTSDPSFFKNQNWALYWNQAPRKPLAINNGSKVKMTHINGDFFSMVPMEGFKPNTDGSLTVEYTGEFAMIKESDAPLGVYFTYKDEHGAEQILKPYNYTISPFSAPAQLVRSVNDKEAIASAENVFINNEKNLTAVQPADLTSIIPRPKALQLLTGQSKIDAQSGYTFDPQLKPEFEYLRDQLAAQVGIQTDRKANGKIILRINPDINDSEGYMLNIQNDHVSIDGGGNAGVFYGIQSFLALANQSEMTDNQISISNVMMEDAPAFPYRGMHIDVGRNFQSKDQILKMLDLMSMYKLNKFLFYLTEDEGWRLAIEEFPELTDVSARRGHTLNEHDYLQPSYGSGPDPTDPSSFGNGHYTREDFKEILQYAQVRHIDVIPEVNFPGHARTAIMAMENRYRRLIKEGKKEEAERYRLIDPDDKSIYESAQGYKDNVVCVCKEAPYKFYEVVLDDIIEMYKEANVPLTMMHTGGDEVPQGAWSKSPLCDELRKEHNAEGDSRNLQAYFFGRLADLIKSRGLPSGAWEEAVMKFSEDGSWSTRTEFVSKDVYPYIWQNLWGNQDLGYKMANLGYPIILCNVTNFYFDLAYDKDPREPGLYWAGFNNSKHAFDFIPFDLFKSTVEDDMGQPFDVEKDFEDKERLTAKGLKNIVGLQSQLWSETIKGGQMLEHYTLPKMLGFAERAWRGQETWMNVDNQTSREDANVAAWSKFINSAVANDFNRLNKHQGGYMYRIPAPGILVESGGVRMNTAYPGMEIRYTSDGSEPTMDSPIYEGGILSLDGAMIKAKCFNQVGRSGLVSEASLKQFEL